MPNHDPSALSLRRDGAAADFNLLGRLRVSIETLPIALRKIGRYVLAHPEDVTHQTIAQLSSASKSGQASVVRFCRVLEFASFQEFKIRLAHELARLTPDQAAAQSDTAPNILNDLLRNTIAALTETRRLLDEEVIDAVAHRILTADRIDIYGAGSSGIVARIFAYHLLRVGINAQAFTDVLWASELIAGLTPRSVAIAISASGFTRETIRVLRGARQVGAFGVAITNNAKSPIGAHADLLLLAYPPDSPLAGSSRTSMTSHVFVIEAIMARLALKRSSSKPVARQKRSKGT